MGLQRQDISLPFGQGIETKVDPFQVPAGKLLQLQNAQFLQGGQLTKRYGYTQLGNLVEGTSAPILSASAISAFNNELLLFDGNNAYAYVPATDNWVNRGTAVSVIATDSQVMRNNSQQLHPDVQVLNGVQVTTWEDSRGGVRYSVIDSVSGTFLVSDVSVDSAATRPRLVSFNANVFLFYMVGVNCYYRRINPKNPTILGPAVSLHSDARSPSDCPYDVVAIDTGSSGFAGLQLMMVAYASSSGSVKMYSITTSYAVTAPRTIVSSDVACIDLAKWVQGSSDVGIWLTWGIGNQVYLDGIDALFHDITGQILIDTCSAAVVNVTSQTTPVTFDTRLFYEVTATADINHVVRTAFRSSFDGTIVANDLVRSVGLASKPFAYNGLVYVNVVYAGAVPPTPGTPQPLQQTYFTVREDSSIIAKIRSGLGGGLRTNGTLSHVPQVSTGVFQFANNVKGQTISQASIIFSLLGVNVTQLDFTDSNKFISTEQSNNLLVVGGMLQAYDGLSMVEDGFNLYPDYVSGSISSGSGGLTTGKSYQYCVCYEWPDNFGQIERSAPSIPLTVVPNVSGPSVTLTIATLRLTAKRGTRTPPRVVVYRTQGNQSIFYRVTSAITPLLNDPTVDTVTFTDSLSDAAIIANEQMYTQPNQVGSVLENIAPPANTIVATYRNRVFVAGLEDPNLLWFSKNKYDNSNLSTVPTEFSEFLTVGVDPRGGPVTALGTMDTNLIIFKQQSIYAIAGDGPSDNGAGTSYGDPQLVTTDCGCINPNSVVVTPMGLMFKSSKGIYLLDRNLQANYVGAPVEAFNDLTITSATLDQKANHVIFTTSADPVLVYNYLFGQWTTWTNHNAIDSDVFQGNFCYVRPDGRVFVQNPGSFVDGASPIAMSWTTANLSFAGLQGYQMVWRFFVLGRYKGPHKLQVSVAYDFSDAYSESVTIDATQVVGQNTWGSDATWGASSPWGGAYVPYEFRIDISNKRCRAIRIQGVDAQSSNFNEGYQISGLLFEVGVINGGARIPATSTFGSK